MDIVQGLRARIFTRHLIATRHVEVLAEVAQGSRLPGDFEALAHAKGALAAFARACSDIDELYPIEGPTPVDRAMLAAYEADPHSL